jgi:hypothetical protein
MSSTNSAINSPTVILLVAAIAFLLLAPSTLHTFDDDALAQSTERADAAQRRVPHQRGMTLGDWGPNAYGSTATREALLELRRRGVRSVTLFTVWMQRDERSSKIAPGPSTVRDVRLKRAIRIARSLRLEVVLRPYVDLLNNGWRGAATPRRPAQWWRDYRRFIVRYAALAQRTGVSMYVIGTEMKSQSGRSARWRALVRHVRARYHGVVTYEANWDEFEDVDWWRAVDVIDISAYFPLASEAGASVEQLAAAWAGPRERIRAVARRFNRPVMLGEAGFTAFAGAAVMPWNVAISGPIDPKAQARAYAATFRAWAGTPWFRGFHWWFFPVERSRVGSRPAHWHIPRAPALDVLTRHYRR